MNSRASSIGSEDEVGEMLGRLRGWRSSRPAAVARGLGSGPAWGRRRRGSWLVRVDWLGQPERTDPSGEGDSLFKCAYRLRGLSDNLSLDASQVDVAIEIERRRDGSLVAFPAVAV